MYRKDNKRDAVISVDALRAVDEMGGDYDDIIEVLKKMGIKASQRN